MDYLIVSTALVIPPIDYLGATYGIGSYSTLEVIFHSQNDTTTSDPISCFGNKYSPSDPRDPFRVYPPQVHCTMTQSTHIFQ